MIQIFHNPRCSKSRQGLQILNELELDFEIIKYIDTPPTIEELKKIVDQLGIKPLQLVRKGEAIWKEKFKGKKLNDEQIIEAMTLYPKLIERPIVINNNKAVIGRPPNTILTLF